METRASFVIVGAFVIIAIGAVFGFVYWLNNSGGVGKRDSYHIAFEEPVPGLLTGAAVLFNGIRVGEVTDLGLVPDQPRAVRATIAVEQHTPVRKDTKVGLDFQGLTGVPVVALEGGNAGTAALDEGGTLVAEKGAGTSMTQAARNALQRVDTILGDNADNLHSTIANLSTFADGLARNTPQLDSIMAGLERMTGGGPAAARKTTYDLSAVGKFDEPRIPLKAEFSVSEPSAVARLQTQRFLFSPDADHSGFDDAQWSDSLPILLQARVLQSFENYDIAHAPLRSEPGADSGTRLVLDLRQFEVQMEPSPHAVVSFSAKLVDSANVVKAARVFQSDSAIAALDPASAALAFNSAFGNAAKDLVSWTAHQL